MLECEHALGQGVVSSGLCSEFLFQGSHWTPCINTATLVYASLNSACTDWPLRVRKAGHGLHCSEQLLINRPLLLVPQLPLQILKVPRVEGAGQSQRQAAHLAGMAGVEGGRGSPLGRAMGGRVPLWWQLGLEGASTSASAPTA